MPHSNDRHGRDTHDHCESCGMRIALLPEDAKWDERLCEFCYFDLPENREDQVNV